MTMSRRLNILILYVSNQYPMRATLWDQLYCFRRYSDHNCFYLNFTVRRVPWYLKHVKFDLIVFGTLFLATRAVAEWFSDPRERARPLKSFDAVKIAFPQDEYLCSDVLADFINEFSIERVFTLAPKTEWPKIYDRIDMARVKLSRVLPGYLDDGTVERIEGLAPAGAPRDIDLGYRTFRAAPNLGRHGFLRQQIAEVFQAEAPKHNCRLIFRHAKKTRFGPMPGTSFSCAANTRSALKAAPRSLIEMDRFKRRTESYLAEHPDASFEEVERACFPGLDGELRYVAISPRHLEACATRTCQVLVEGEYNDVLVPGRHYLELKRDFSNLEQFWRPLNRTPPPGNHRTGFPRYCRIRRLHVSQFCRTRPPRGSAESSTGFGRKPGLIDSSYLSMDALIGFHCLGPGGAEPAFFRAPATE
jgi:hypothetical protein